MRHSTVIGLTRPARAATRQPHRDYLGHAPGPFGMKGLAKECLQRYLCIMTTDETPPAPAADAQSVTRLTDPRALRAYAHPVRMALMGLLRTGGPLPETRDAGLL